MQFLEFGEFFLDEHWLFDNMFEDNNGLPNFVTKTHGLLLKQMAEVPMINCIKIANYTKFPCFALVFLLLSVSSVNAGIMFQADVQRGSDPLETNVLVEQVGDDLLVRLAVDSSVTGNVGDLRGFFFRVADESILGGLSASGVDVTDQQFDANNVSDLGNGANVNGSLVNGPLGGFDGGVEFGQSGLRGGGDDIQLTEFLLSHSTEVLDLNTFFPTFSGVDEFVFAVGVDEFVLAVRGTSVGPVDGAREGSSITGGGGLTVGAVPEPGSAWVWLSGVALCALLRGRNKCSTVS